MTQGEQIAWDNGYITGAMLHGVIRGTSTKASEYQVYKSIVREFSILSYTLLESATYE